MNEHVTASLAPDRRGMDALKIATFGISGMHCASCSVRNERVLNKLEGVRSASVNLATHSARVEFDGSVLSEGAIHQAVVEGGYGVLTQESAQDHKERARHELQSARMKAFLALLFAFPVA